MAFGDFKALPDVQERFNIADADLPVYGIVSDGTLWQFGYLVGDAFTRNRTSFSVDDLSSLFRAINAIFKAASRTPSRS